MNASERRQADALEELAEQTRIQNAVLLELVHEQRARRRLEQGDLPHEFSAEGLAGSIEDRALELTERVDLEAVDTYADSDLMTDGGDDVVGCDESAEPEHECANCGATYNGPGAALECCSDQTRTDGAGQLQEHEASGTSDETATKVDPSDPERLSPHYTPAYIMSRQHGERFVASYMILDSGWIRVTDWNGDRWKYPPSEVTAVRETKTERYGERDEHGYRPIRLVDEEEIQKAREKGAKQSDE